ncbi:MAG: hypothetical protein HOO01_07065 [Cellvibrionales bacterium]|jgi:hypothetical protein|nr:hypothetical protein [Cellvibrionales bacterium]MBT5923267.1 hypothetical protein [Cellvibrionales bacterium]MBT6580018.1 hypothetical protein [Cellvibrionales bacterium]
MSIQSLPKTDQDNAPKMSNRQHLKNCFAIKNGRWFVTNKRNEQAGPFNDKSEAQMALLYYVGRTCWPSAKQLREFTRLGR